MANRMDIELTSARGDDTFTWRAAGARQPKGVVATATLPAGAKVGDVLRAEVEIELDGITVLSILPPKQKATPAGTIEYIGPGKAQGGVTTVLASKTERRGRPFGDGERTGRRPGSDRDRPRAGAGARTGTGGRTERAPGAERRDDRPRREAPRREGPGREGAARSGAPERRDASATRPPARRTPPRFEPGTAHRDELFASFTPEQRAIADRLAVGGLPGLRRALAEEQQKARAEGRPVTSGEPIIALAESLLPAVKAAVWLDRAEAAAAKPDEVPLRDLRATVVAAAPRDEAGRALEHQLREALERRVTKLRQDWETHLTQALDDGRVLQALRLSAKPPEPTAQFPATLVQRLAQQASEAMKSDVGAERWLALLEAASASPVRRQIKPAGLPDDPTGEVERQSRMAASRIPALARLLGMPIPPPPKPVAGERPVRPPRPPRPSRPRPARPAEPGQATAAAASDSADASAPGAEPVATEPGHEDAAPGPVGTTAELAEPAAATSSEAVAATPAEPEAATETAFSDDSTGEAGDGPAGESVGTEAPVAAVEVPEAASEEAVVAEEAPEPLDEA